MNINVNNNQMVSYITSYFKNNPKSDIPYDELYEKFNLERRRMTSAQDLNKFELIGYLYHLVEKNYNDNDIKNLFKLRKETIFNQIDVLFKEMETLAERKDQQHLSFLGVVEENLSNFIEKEIILKNANLKFKDENVQYAYLFINNYYLAEIEKEELKVNNEAFYSGDVSPISIVYDFYVYIDRNGLSEKDILDKEKFSLLAKLNIMHKSFNQEEKEVIGDNFNKIFNQYVKYEKDFVKLNDNYPTLDETVFLVKKELKNILKEKNLKNVQKEVESALDKKVNNIKNNKI